MSICNIARRSRPGLPLIPIVLRWLVALALVIPRVVPAGNFYSGRSPSNVPWPGGVVPYEFTNSLTPQELETYMDGLREWELAANVSFVPHTNQTHWVLFTYNTNWIDNVSPGTNPQVVTVGSLSRAQVCHEMGHSFGFTHENIRPDSTNFISVLTNNITGESSNIMYFTLDPTSVTNGAYDFESVMHLGWDFLSTNFGVVATQQPKPQYFAKYQYRLGNLCLSPGDRAALAYLYGPPAVPLTNVVTNTLDYGPGSLRAAMYYATDHPGTSVRFSIPITDPGYSNGVFNIHLTGHLPPLATNGMVIDGSTQPGFAGKPLVFVDGSQIIPETATSNSGLLFYGNSNQVKNISFSGFNWNGITMEYSFASNNTVSGCWLGIDATGTNPAPNAYEGILVTSGASRNTFGGTNANARNVLSGNTLYGIYFTDSNTAGNVVLGSYLGTDPSGSIAVPNGKSGALIDAGANGNVIGSTNAAGRNVLSGNTEYGVWLSDTNTENNEIEGNYLGLNASGTAALPNQLSGVGIYGGAQSNIVGGSVAGAGNVLSGNNNYGVEISDPGTSGNVVAGNLVGLDAAGTNAIPNANSGLYLQNYATSNIIGGTTAGARNVVSGNNTSGVYLLGSGTSYNQVEGNYIGTDPTGTNSIGNTIAGVYLLFGANSNIVGGTTAGARNVISGNDSYGVYFLGAGTSYNQVEGNYVGLTPDGEHALGNDFSGVIIFGGAGTNTFGPNNVVSGNSSYGLYIDNAGTTGNWIEGNTIGADSTGASPVPNGTGLIIFGGTTTNFIGLGPSGLGTGNEIAYNSGDALLVGDTNTLGIDMRGNTIVGNGSLGIDLQNAANGTPNPPVITNAFGYGTSTIVTGTLNSTPSQVFTIDFYANLSNDPGQAEYYLGSASMATGGSGKGSFAYTNTTANYSGDYITATATSPAYDTSEFSADVLATNKPAPSAVFTGPYTWHPAGFSFGLTLATNFNYQIEAATNLKSPVTWFVLTNYLATNSLFNFTDHTSSNQPERFYRVVSP
jgi:hypothetical protein